MFFAGVRPAINVGISVSRVGGNAQTKAMKKIAGWLETGLGGVSRTGSLFPTRDRTGQGDAKQLDRGARLVELLKQPQFKPMPVDQEVMVVYAGTQGFLDDVPIPRVQEFQAAFLAYVDAAAGDFRKELSEKGELTADLETKLKQILNDFKSKGWKK